MPGSATLCRQRGRYNRRYNHRSCLVGGRGLRTRLGHAVELSVARSLAASELSVARSLAASELSVEPLRPADLGRGAELLDRYPQIGFVDATIAAMAERLKLPSIVTTDRRHFSMLRPAHVEAF